MNKRDFVEHDALCPLPWAGIYVNPDGKIQNCAISRTGLGNIHESPLESILDGPVNQQIRKDMLDGIRHSRCDACYQVENNATDKRQNESNRTWYKKLTIKHKLDLEIFQTTNGFQPSVLDLRWRNTCNQACIYCGPDLSSLWQDLMGMEYKIEESVLDQSKNYIFDNLHTVKHVYLAGGEPLLIKENQTLLERLLAVNPDAEIRVNSNIGNIRTPVFESLKKFPNVKWTISVDSMERSFEYMRWPGKWGEFLDNLKEIKAIVGDQINFNMVWCILNAEDIIDTVDFLIDQGYHENAFIVQCLTFPKTLSVLNLPNDQRQQLQQHILKRQQQADPVYWVYKSLSSMYNFLNNSTANGSDIFFKKIPLDPGISGTFRFLQDIDKLRGTDSSKIFTKLYQLK